MTFFLTYWKPLLIAAILFVVYVYGHAVGYNDADDFWQKKFTEAKLAAFARHDADQKKINESEQKYLDEKAKNEKAFTEAKNEVRNEYSTNSDYVRCHVSPDFLRVYRKLSGTTSSPVPVISK